MAIRLENKPQKRMASYLEDDEILELLEKSEDDERWREEEQIESSDDEGEIDHLSVEELSSSDISDIDEDQDTSTIFISRNKKENWSATPHTNNIGQTASCNIYHKSPGPSRFAKSQCDSMPDSFRLFFGDKLLEKVRNWINAEGLLIYKDKWLALNHSEFDTFLGVVIFIGIYKSNNKNATRLWSKEDGRPIFNKLMSRNRYQQILRVLRFDDANSRRRNRSEDKFQPIRDVFEQWDLNLRNAYTPGPHMTVDEQLVCFRGRCLFLQYISSNLESMK